MWLPRAMSWAAATKSTSLASLGLGCANALNAAAQKTKINAMRRFMGSAHLGGNLQHLVRGRDDLGIHFIGALGSDEIGDLFHRIDIGGLDESLLDLAEARCARKSRNDGPGRCRFRVEIIAQGLQPPFIGKPRHFKLTQRLWCTLTANQSLYLADTVDGDGNCILR